MKKYIAILCLFTLILAGCGKETTEEAETTVAATVETTAAPAEQVVNQAESAIAGSWVATLDKGAYAAAIFLEDQEEAALFEKADYPLTVILNLNEDGSYYFELKSDDGTGFDAFVKSFAAIATENGQELTEEDARQLLLGGRMDKLFLMSQVEEGTWEHTDQGLVLSGWCTVQFHMDGEALYWDSCDDEMLAENLPITFNK